MNARASPRGLATAVMCLVLLVAVNGAGWSELESPFDNPHLNFDVTITGGHTSGLYHYEYTASIAEPGSDVDCYGWFMTGAEYIDLGSIGETNVAYQAGPPPTGGYSWWDAEIVQPGEKPSHQTAAGLTNPTNGPVIWWVRSSLDGSGTYAGDIGTFWFDSPKAPMNRQWLAHDPGSTQATGSVTGPSPELSPLLLLLGQGVPLLGFIGWRRRQRS